MKRNPHFTPVLVLAAVMAASVPARAVPRRSPGKEEKTVVPAKGRIALVVKNARGRTVIVGRPDATAVSIVGVKTVVSRDNDDARTMMDRLKMDVSEKGDQVVVETRDDNKYEDWGWSVMQVVKGNRRSSWIDYTIEVPVSFRVNASTSSGEVRNFQHRPEAQTWRRRAAMYRCAVSARVLRSWR
jgi:hypothetical protein